MELPLRILPPGPGTARAAVDPLGREALTCYESLAVYSCDNKIWSLVRAKPKTGRASKSGQAFLCQYPSVAWKLQPHGLLDEGMHQIRAHLASTGLPLVGDRCLPAQQQLQHIAALRHRERSLDLYLWLNIVVSLSFPYLYGCPVQAVFLQPAPTSASNKL